MAALLSLAFPIWAASPASVSGVVEDGNHTPLMGAVVELFHSGPFPLLTAFTDVRGRYAFSDLTPGNYSIRVLQASSMPAHRKNIQVDRAAHVIVNMNLISVFGLAHWFPAVPRKADEPQDDWKWTLRSGVNRPILRWMGPSDKSGASEQDTDNAGSNHPAHPVKVRAEVKSASPLFGEGGFRQEALLQMQKGRSTDALVHVQSSTSGAAFVAAGMERNPMPGDSTRAVASFRSMPADFGSGLGRLQVFQARGGEQIALSDAIVAQFGAETESVQAGNNVTAVLPFMAVQVQAAGNQVSYNMATSSDLQGLTDLANSSAVPAVAMADGNLRLTHSLHQEISVRRELAGVQLETAYFYDHFVDPVLNGYGDASAAEFASGNVLLDPVTGAFRSVGPNYSGGGFRILATRKMKGNVWTTVEYAEGPSITLPAASLVNPSSFTDALTNVATTRTSSVLFSMRGHITGPGTGWNAGYRWQPEATITAVDPFQAGMNAPFLSVTLRQPLSSSSSSPDRLELEFVVQNLLAQGYRPIYIVAGQTLYFAQAPRLITGGLAFSF